MNTAIILNGPPAVGKDTLADLLSEYVHCQFKKALYKVTAGFYQRDYNEFVLHATDRHLKEAPFYKGMTPREMLIHVSEEVYKPVFGEDYFGQEAAKDALPHNSDVVFSDGGFYDEIVGLSQEFKIKLFRLHRPGFDFTGDSRSYIKWPGAIDIYLQEGKPEWGVEDIKFHL